MLMMLHPARPGDVSVTFSRREKAIETKGARVFKCRPSVEAERSVSTELARFSKIELIYKVRCSILLRFSYASIFLSLNCLLYEIYAMHSFSFQAFFSCARRRIELATTGGYKKNSKKICSRTQCSIVCAKNVACWTLNADRRLRTTKPQSTCNTPIYMLSREQSSGLRSA